MEQRSRQPSQPQMLPATTFGQTTVRRMSRLWRPNHDPSSSATTPAPGKSFVVPLFLSRSSAAQGQGQGQVFARGAVPSSIRSRSSTRSVIEDTVPGTSGVRPLSVPRDTRSEVSDMYTGGGSVQAPESVIPIPLARNMDDEPTPSERVAIRSHRSASSGSNSSKRSSRKRSIFSKESYRDPHVNSKAKISFAFGVTLLVALVIYLVLAATGVAKNTMFHVISILFLLTLTGVFIHQLLRMFMLIRRPRRSRSRSGAAAAVSAHGSRRRHHARGGSRENHDQPHRHRARRHKDTGPELVLEKPIPIHMASDAGDSTGGFGPDVEAQPIHVTVQHPPPVYGNFRTSIRINPDLVHWKEIQAREPSPMTPTYDEAMNQIHQTMGYRPPSYLSESGGTDVVMETQRRDVDAALENIHPLERERLRGLTADALEGRR